MVARCAKAATDDAEALGRGSPDPNPMKADPGAHSSPLPSPLSPGGLGGGRENAARHSVRSAINGSTRVARRAGR